MSTEESKQTICDAKPLILASGRQDILTTLCKLLEIPTEVKSVRAYGTFDKQLFIAVDVLKVLNVTRIDYTSYENDFHKVLVMAYAEGAGERSHIAFTELGLMKLLMRTESVISKKFQVYIIIVLKKLMYDGMVTLEAVNAEYKKRLENKSQELSASDSAGSSLEIELKLAKDTIAKYKDDISRLKHQITLENNPDNQKNIEYLMQQSATPVHVVLCTAPKYKVKDPREYDIDDEDAFDAGEVYVYTLKSAPKEEKTKKILEEKIPTMSVQEYQKQAHTELMLRLTTGKKLKSERKSTKEGRVVGVVYMHKQENIEILQALLTSSTTRVEQTDGTFQIDRHATSLIEIKNIIYDHYISRLPYYRSGCA